MLTQEKLKWLVHYDPATGVLRRLSDGRDSWSIGTHGYRRVNLDGAEYLLHRLAVMYMTGEFPREDTDHANGDRLDNRWLNIKPLTYSENQQNRGGPQRNNKLGVLGVRKVKNRFQAQIRVGGVQHYLGLFATAEDAHAAYMAAKRRLHTNSPRLLAPQCL